MSEYRCLGYDVLRTTMTEADIKIAAYQDAIEIASTLQTSVGPTTAVGIRMVIAKLADRIEEIADREVHRKAVEAMA